MIELPLTKPEFFVRVGIKAPKGVLLYGPLASTMHATFVKTVASSLIESYIGESSRVIRELFSATRRAG